MIDVIIIGAGPGGFDLAVQLAKAKKQVVLIDKQQVGGTCLHLGCVPTKTLVHVAEIIKETRKLSHLGLELDTSKLTLTQLWEHKDKIVATITQDMLSSIRHLPIELLMGEATILSPHQVKVNDQIYEANHIVIATGSSPSRLNTPGFDHARVYDSNTIYSLKSLPKSIAIIGGGYIGIEWATIFATLGVKVTIIESMPQILSTLDDDLGKRLSTYLKKDGIDIRTSSSISQLKHLDEGVEIVTKQDPPLQVEVVLVAVGRTPNVNHLNLSHLGIDVLKTGIPVNEFYQTNVPSIYAIGDVIGGIMLAHKASFDAKKLAGILTNNPFTFDANLIPSIIFSSPQIAVVGANERTLKEKMIPYQTIRVPYRGNCKAVATLATEGYLKLIVDENQMLLGAQVIGAHAEDLIHELALMIETRRPLSSFKSIIHAHPTLSEIIYSALSLV